MMLKPSRGRRVVVAAAAFALAIGAGSAVARAVSVSPMSVFLDHRTRTGSITLYNPNPLPEEIEISFAFGYPQSDSTGEVSVSLADTAPEGEPSAVAWLRAFPRRLRLEPGQHQVVRILAQPPADLPDGEYWSRVVVIASGGRPPVEQQVEPDVRVAITMRTIVVGSLNYRKGRLATGVAVTGAHAERTADGARLTLDLQRQGAAAYLGTVRVQALDAAGRVVAEEEDVLSVYRTIRRRFTFSGARDVAAFRYTMATERPELGQSNIIAAQPVTGTVQVR
jgi:P pilus assembly chaperone PapD